MTTSIARHPDQCDRCAGPIHPGQAIRQAVGGGWQHVSCPDEPDDLRPPRPPRHDRTNRTKGHRR